MFLSPASSFLIKVLLGIVLLPNSFAGPTLCKLLHNVGYYVLMNRWQILVIQKWIAEYHEKGYFESQRAKDYLLFYLKASEKAPVRVLNSMGVQVKVKMTPR